MELLPALVFLALKPWAESTFQKNPDKIEIPKDEDIQDTLAEDTQPVQQELTIESYKELNSLLTQTSIEAKNVCSRSGRNA